MLGRIHFDTLGSLLNLAQFKIALGHHKEAETCLIEVLQQRKECLGKSHPDTIIVMRRLAYTWWKQGRRFRSERLLAEAVRLNRETLGSQHPHTVIAAELSSSWRLELAHLLAVYLSSVLALFILSALYSDGFEAHHDVFSEMKDVDTAILNGSNARITFEECKLEERLLS